MRSHLTDAIAAAADALRSAEALLVTAGAGMGVDSGLPDFRGPEGFWRAYPAYRKLGLRFEELACPVWFQRDPELAWGFYGHRLNLYRSARPHAGFRILFDWSRRLPAGVFVLTSNVDGQFQQAGFADDGVTECHGSIHWLQCTAGCGAPLFSAEGVEIDVCPDTFRARDPLPCCPRCGALARPAILMFGDWEWDSSRTDAQQERLCHWLAARQREDARLAVIECGAGTAIPTIRRFGESLVRSHGATLVRINPREPDVPPGQIGIAAGAREALQAIQGVLT